MNLQLFKVEQTLLKYIAVYCDIVMTKHIYLLTQGENSLIDEYVAGYSVAGFIALFIASFLLKFCWLYRSFIIHTFMTYSCIIYQRVVGFGDILQPLRYIMLAVGIFLCLWLASRVTKILFRWIKSIIK